MERPQLEVVIVAYGAADLLEQCLAGLGAAWPVHVVDNSASLEVAACAERHGCDYQVSLENVGFAAGVNRGLAACDPSADVLLLNPDAIIRPEAVLHLQNALHATSDLAAVAPSLIRRDGSAEPTRWPIPTPVQPWRGIVGGSGERGEYFLSGAVLLVGAQARAAVGGFDERYFLYAEETDWQRRALNLGWRLQHVPEVTAGHLGGGTSTDAMKRDLYFHASAEAYLRKWHGSAGWQFARLGSLLAALRRSVTGSREARREARRAVRLYVQGPRRALRRHRAKA